MKEIEYTVKGIVKYLLFFLSGNKDFKAFHHFPFNFNAPMPEGASAIMSMCCDELEKLKVNYRLTDGTVLGLYRQGAFIPHDNDIDVDILDCKDISMIQTRMKTLGMKLGRKAIYKNKIHQLAYYSEGHVIFDMIFWYTDGDKIVNFSEEGYKRTQPRKHFINFDRISFDSRTYPIPFNIEEWLVLRFGEDWKTPRTYKDDWKKECRDLQKL